MSLNKSSLIVKTLWGDLVAFSLARIRSASRNQCDKSWVWCFRKRNAASKWNDEWYPYWSMFLNVVIVDRTYLHLCSTDVIYSAYIIGLGQFSLDLISSNSFLRISVLSWNQCACPIFKRTKCFLGYTSMHTWTWFEKHWHLEKIKWALRVVHDWWYFLNVHTMKSLYEI